MDEVVLRIKLEEDAGGGAPPGTGTAPGAAGTPGAGGYRGPMDPAGIGALGARSFNYKGESPSERAFEDFARADVRREIAKAERDRAEEERDKAYDDFFRKGIGTEAAYLAAVERLKEATLGLEGARWEATKEEHLLAHAIRDETMAREAEEEATRRSLDAQRNGAILQQEAEQEAARRSLDAQRNIALLQQERDERAAVSFKRGALFGGAGAYSAKREFGTEGAVAGAAGVAMMAGISALVNRSISAVGSLAANAINPSADPSQSIATVGQAADVASKALFAISPPAGIVVGAFGALAGVTSGLMKSFDGMVSRYGQYSPAVAQAQAQAEITQVLGDMSRAQRAAPDLVEYIQKRSEIQQQFEERKIKLIEDFGPKLLTFMEFMAGFADILIGGASAAGGFLDTITFGLFSVDSNTKAIRNSMENAEMAGMDPTKIISEGYVAPGQEGGRKKGSFIQTPNV